MKKLLGLMLPLLIVGCAVNPPASKVYDFDNETYYSPSATVFEAVPSPRAQITNNGAIKAGFSNLYPKQYYICSGKDLDKIVQFCLKQCSIHLGEDKAKSYCRVYKVSETQGQRQIIEKTIAYNSELNKIKPDIWTQRRNSAQLVKENQVKRLEAARQNELKQQQIKLEVYVNEKKSLCMSYGFEGVNAIATCVQKEINLEKERMQQKSILVQQSTGLNYDAIGNYGRCLGTQGETFSSCSNAWQGYTPPKKTVTKCRYDTFGNVITGTCTTQ
jgi:hypothetical protein